MTTEQLSPSAAPARVIALLGAGSFVSAASLRVADTLLPQFAAEFRVSTGDAAIVVTSFALSYGLSQIFYGPLGDRFGKLRVIIVAMIIAAIGIAGSAFAPDLRSLVLLRLISGAGAAAIVPLSMAYIGDVVAYEQRQAILARFLTGFILGTAFGQSAGGWFADHLGWRGLFVIFAALFLGVDLLLWRATADMAERQAPREKLASIALRYLRILRRRPAQIVLATVGAEAFLFYGAFAFIGAYLRYEKDLDLTRIGLTLACFGLGGVLYSMVLVRLFVRGLGERGMAALGGMLLAASYVGLALLERPLLAPLAVAGLGLGYYLLHNTLQVRGTQMAPEDRGIAMSLFASMLYLGQALGVALGGIGIDRIGYAPILGGAGLLLGVLAVAFAATLRRR
jgi:MFS transporter, YNFM family, putative membrane transport protein